MEKGRASFSDVSEARQRSVAACGALLLVALFLFRSAVFGGQALFERDTAFWYYPQADDIVRILTSGALPLWHPYRSFGEPLLANPSNQILYPPAYLHLLFEPWTAYTFYVVGHLVFSGMGEYLLARRLGLSATSSFLAAAAWMASGPLLSTVNMWNHFSGATWLPWVLLAARRAGDTREPRDALLWGGALAGQALAGSPDSSAMAALCSVAAVLDRLRWSRPRDPLNLRLIATSALAAAFAAALAAAQWLPSADLLPGSLRLALPESARTRWSVPAPAMLQLAVPLALKGLTLETSDAVLAADSVYNPLLASLYLGAPMLVLAAAGLFGPRRPMRVFLAGVLAVACCVALGRYSPFLGALSSLLPLHTLFRHPVKAMVLVPLASGLLAGMGLDALRGSSSPRPRSVPLALCSSLLVCACAVSAGLALAALAGRLALPFRSEPLLLQNLELTARHALSAALAGLVVCWLLLRRPAASPRAALLLAALAIAELAYVNQRINPTCPAEALAQRPATAAAIAADGAPAGTRVYSWDYTLKVQGKQHPAPHVARALEGPGLHSLARVIGLRTLYPSCGRWGLSGSFEPDVLGFSPAHMRTLVISLRAAEETPLYVRLLQMGSVSYVLALHRESFGDLAPVAEVPGPFPLKVQVFRVPDPLPRVYAVGAGRLVGRDAGYRALADDGFDFRRDVLLAEGPVVASANFSARLRVRETKPDRLRVDADFQAPGYLVVTDAYDPGWKASVDGQPAAVQRANVGFRAVQVPAGSHVVEMVYRPAAVSVGFAISGLALAFALAVIGLRRAPRHAE